LLPSTKREDGILQSLDAGEPEGCGSGIESPKLLGQRGDTLAETVREPGCPGKSWCRLDEDAEGNGTGADGVTATPSGSSPTGIVAITVLVAVAITDTLSDTAFAT
jgi:hypothetical protein